MSNNNDNGGAIFGIAVACAALALTILSVIAWKSPVKLGERTLCTPMEARIFVVSGVLGAVAVCAFALLCTVLFDTRMKDGWWFYLITGGYAFTSLVVLMNMAEQYPNGHPNDPDYQGTVIEHDLAPAPQLPSVTTCTPFEYASWNDEVIEAPPAKPECQGCWLNAVPRDPDVPVPPR